MTTTKQTTSMKPVYHEQLGRTVLTTGKGTVRLFCLVNVPTLAQHEAWQLAHPGTSSGKIIDQLTAHALKTGFTIS